MKGLEIPAQLLMAYFLVHLRFVGMMFSSPIFFSSQTPMPFRYLCAVLLTVASTAMLGHAQIPMVLFDNWVSVFIIALRELFVGLTIGLLATLPLTALQIAGEQIAVSMGFSMASIMDPLTQLQSTVVGQLQFVVGMWFYFHWNGHLYLVQAVIESLNLVPLAKLSLVPANDMNLGLWMQEAFRLAMKAVLPFYCSLLLADLGLGFLARTVPQMNVFVLGLPMKVALGFFVLVVALPLTADMLYVYLEKWIEFALASATAWR